MEEYITRTEFEQFKRRVEQKTEEIRTVKVEVASKDVLDRLDALKQELDERSDTWLDTLQEHYTEYKEDICKLETSVKNDMAAMKEDIIDAIRRYSQPGKN